MPDLTPVPSPAPSKDGLPVLPFPGPADWEAWLEEHATTSRGVWLRLAKKGSGVPSVTYPEALEVALCFGWVDGQKASDDDPWYRLRFTPRTSRSKWSQVNRDATLALLAAGRVRPAGLQAVEAAQADGRWEAAYAPPSTAEVPEDLQAALDASPAAAAVFARLDSRNRYAVLHRVTTAKRVATRQRRVEEFVAMLADGRAPYPQDGLGASPQE